LDQIYIILIIGLKHEKLIVDVSSVIDVIPNSTVGRIDQRPFHDCISIRRHMFLRSVAIIVCVCRP